MKNLFLKIWIVALILCSTVFYANPVKIAEKGEAFLNNYYSEGYNLGKSIETKVNDEKILVSEVINQNTGTINGYVAVNNVSKEILYFIDYLAKTKEIKTIDFKNNVTEIINLQKGNNFENFTKIDIIKAIEKVNSDPASVNKFWGWEYGSSWTLENGSCYQTRCHYVFWMENGCEVVGC